MLALALSPEEYVTIGDVVVKVSRVTPGHVYLAIDAPREIPIVRGKVLERGGAQRPACLDGQQ